MSSIWPQQQECHTLEMYIQLRHVDTSSKQAGEGGSSESDSHWQRTSDIERHFEEWRNKYPHPADLPCPVLSDQWSLALASDMCQFCIISTFLTARMKRRQGMNFKGSYSVVTSSSARVLILSVRRVSAMRQKKSFTP